MLRALMRNTIAVSLRRDELFGASCCATEEAVSAEHAHQSVGNGGSSIRSDEHSMEAHHAERDGYFVTDLRVR